MASASGFNFADDCMVWWIPANFDSYEMLYNTTKLSEMKAVNTPVTMKTPDGIHISIHEANLTDYAGMTIKPVEGSELVF